MNSLPEFSYTQWKACGYLYQTGLILSVLLEAPLHLWTVNSSFYVKSNCWK